MDDLPSKVKNSHMNKGKWLGKDSCPWSSWGKKKMSPKQMTEAIQVLWIAGKSKSTKRRKPMSST